MWNDCLLSEHHQSFKLMRQWKKQYMIMQLMMMHIGMIQNSRYRATFPDFSVFNFAVFFPLTVCIIIS